MTTFVDEIAKCGGISAKCGEIWRGNGKILRDLAEKCGILTESGRKQRNLAKKGEIWRNISKIKKLRNVAKFEKNDEVWRNLSMKWRNVAEFGGISAEFGEI